MRHLGFGAQVQKGSIAEKPPKRRRHNTLFITLPYPASSACEHPRLRGGLFPLNLRKNGAAMTVSRDGSQCLRDHYHRSKTIIQKRVSHVNYLNTNNWWLRRPQNPSGRTSKTSVVVVARYNTKHKELAPTMQNARSCTRRKLSNIQPLEMAFAEVVAWTWRVRPQQVDHILSLALVGQSRLKESKQSRLCCLDLLLALETSLSRALPNPGFAWMFRVLDIG